MNIGYRCCETCGNTMCNSSLVATVYDQCLKKEYAFWEPKYVWIGMDSTTPEEVDEMCKQADAIMEYLRRKEQIR